VCNALGHNLTQLGTTWHNTLPKCLPQPPPLIVMPFILTDGAGKGSVSQPMAPGFSGWSLWFQGLDLTPGTLTNPVASVIG
jgi:hypothetical protein